MNSQCRNNHPSGFTLIEVLISMAILVFISFAIYQATTETYKLREVLSTEGNFYNGIRLATLIIQRDIAMIYSPTLSLPDKETKEKSGNSGNQFSVNPQEMQALTSDDASVESTYWSSALTSSGIRASRLIGSSDKLSFISLSHNRIYKDSQESEIAKISYEIKKDEKDKVNSPQTFVLVKTESPNVFATDDFKDTGKRSFEILSGIKTLSYVYYKRDGNTWKKSKTWDTLKEDDTKTNFPDIIELNLQVIGPRKQIFDGQFKFRPEMPLNGLNPKN